MWLYQMAQYTSSLSSARELLKQEPENELALFTIFLNLQKLNQKEQALQALQKIKELDKDSFANKVARHLLHE